MVESDHALLIHAERKGWPTQASTAAMAMLMQLALDIASESGDVGRVDPATLTSLQTALDTAPAAIAGVIMSSWYRHLPWCSVNGCCGGPA